MAHSSNLSALTGTTDIWYFPNSVWSERTGWPNVSENPCGSKIGIWDAKVLPALRTWDQSNSIWDCKAQTGWEGEHCSNCQVVEFKSVLKKICRRNQINFELCELKAKCSRVKAICVLSTHALYPPVCPTSSTCINKNTTGKIKRTSLYLKCLILKHTFNISALKK